MSNTAYKPKLGWLLRQTVTEVRTHLEVALLLIALAALINTILTAPFFNEIAAIQKMEGSPDAVQQAIQQFAPILLISLIFGTALLLIIPVVWSRILLLGRQEALKSDLFKRYAMVLVRFLAFIGFHILLLIGFSLVALLLQALNTFLSVPSIFSKGLLVAAGLATFVPLYLGFGLSVVSSSVERGFGIMESVKKLQDIWLAYLLASLVIAFLTGLPAYAFEQLLTTEDGLPTRASTITTNIFNSANLLFTLTVAAVLYRSFLVTERKDTEDETSTQ